MPCDIEPRQLTGRSGFVRSALLKRFISIVVASVLMAAPSLAIGDEAKKISTDELLGRWTLEWWTSFRGQDLKGPTVRADAEKEGNVIVIVPEFLRAVLESDGSVTWEHRSQCRLRPWEWRSVNVRVSRDRREIRLSFSDYIEEGNRCVRVTYKELYTRE